VIPGLWQNHPATPRQQHLVFRNRKSCGRATQADVLIAMLRDARDNGKAVDLPAILAVGIGQHSARFNEIRRRGFEIQNELDRDSNGVVRSRYWLRHDPERDGAHGK
jgi:hypothetical protein